MWTQSVQYSLQHYNKTENVKHEQLLQMYT